MLRFTQHDSPLTADKDRGVHAQPSPPTQQDGTAEGSEQAPRRLRTILSIGFGGLLVIMFVAGFTALQTLKDLHAAEENVRHEYVTRNQVLMRVTFLVNAYDGQVERYLLSVTSVHGATAPGEIAQQAAEADAALKSYPGNGDTSEQLLLADMARQLAEEERTVQWILSWSAQERRRRGVEVMNRELMPRRLRIQETSQQIAVSNRQRLNDGPLLEQFSVLRGRLTRMVFLALVAGLLLSLMSAFYILRLEGQAQRRYEELARSRHDLEELSARLVDAQETERRSLSRELHDEVGQSLGALLVDVGRLSNLMPSDSTQVREQLCRIRTVAENAVNTVRNMALLLRPSMLDDLGLVPALEWQAREVSRRTEMEVEVHALNVSERLPDEHKICIYRIVQEALNNAARHASSRTASVTLTQDSQKIQVSIVDQGRGFDTRRVRGLGLVGMDERVKRLGGTLTIESSPGLGTAVKAELPAPATTSSENHEASSRTAGRRP
jgi:signal transduction histidine kinase